MTAVKQFKNWSETLGKSEADASWESRYIWRAFSSTPTTTCSTHTYWFYQLCMPCNTTTYHSDVADEKADRFLTIKSSWYKGRLFIDLTFFHSTPIYAREQLFNLRFLKQSEDIDTMIGYVRSVVFIAMIHRMVTRAGREVPQGTASAKIAAWRRQRCTLVQI